MLSWSVVTLVMGGPVSVVMVSSNDLQCCGKNVCLLPPLEAEVGLVTSA